MLRSAAVLGAGLLCLALSQDAFYDDGFDLLDGDGPNSRGLLPSIGMAGNSTPNGCTNTTCNFNIALPVPNIDPVAANASLRAQQHNLTALGLSLNTANTSFANNQTTALDQIMGLSNAIAQLMGNISSSNNSLESTMGQLYAQQAELQGLSQQVACIQSKAQGHCVQTRPVSTTTAVPSPCSPNPCLNGGTCGILASNPSMFTCSCGSWYTGRLCEASLCPAITQRASVNGTKFKLPPYGSGVTGACGPLTIRGPPGYTLAYQDLVDYSTQGHCNAVGVTVKALTSRDPDVLTTEYSSCGGNHLNTFGKALGELQVTLSGTSSFPTQMYFKVTAVPPPGPCDSNPCQNGGTCNPSGSPLCFCPHTTSACYTGLHCQSESNPCDSAPFNNPKYCNNTGNGYCEVQLTSNGCKGTCHCLNGHSGTYCQLP